MNTGSGGLPSFTTRTAFDFYRSIESRLPGISAGQSSLHPGSPAQPRTASDLLAVAEYYDVFVFDAFGVLNVGDTAIPGARDCIAELRKLGKRVFVLTNGASLSLDKIAQKFARYDMDFSEDEVVSSRYCAEEAALQLANDRPDIKLWGVISAGKSSVDDVPVAAIELDSNPDDYEKVDAILFLSALTWNSDRQQILMQSLRKQKKPVIVANPDVVAPRETDFSLEPGYFSHLLLNQLDLPVQFHGKPFPSVFDEVTRRCGDSVNPQRIAMVGDTLHTDVLGANAYGWSSILVTDHGLFRGENTKQFIDECQIFPQWIVPTIGAS